MPGPIQNVPLRTVLFDGTTPESRDLIKSLGNINRTWANFFSRGSSLIQQGTHAERLILDAAGVPDGGIFVETDRRAIYESRAVSGKPAWIFVLGAMSDLIAKQPTDLGTNDAGFLFYATDATSYRWSGTAWIALATPGAPGAPGPTTQSVVTGSRALGKTYHNTGASPLFVTVTLRIYNGGISSAITDTAATPTTVVASMVSPLPDILYMPVSFWVLPGSYYKVVQVSSTVVLNSWVEWQ